MVWFVYDLFCLFFGDYWVGFFLELLCFTPTSALGFYLNKKLNIKPIKPGHGTPASFEPSGTNSPPPGWGSGPEFWTMVVFGIICGGVVLYCFYKSDQKDRLQELFEKKLLEEEKRLKELELAELRAAEEFRDISFHPIKYFVLNSFNYVTGYMQDHFPFIKNFFISWLELVQLIIPGIPYWSQLLLFFASFSIPIHVFSLLTHARLARKFFLLTKKFFAWFRKKFPA